MTAQPTDTQPIDLKRLSRTLGVDDETVLMSFLDIFLEELPKLSANLLHAIEAQDTKATHHAAHAAKGAAANAAAPVLTQLLKSIHEDAHQEDWAAMSAIFNEIALEHKKIITYRRTHKT